MGSLGVIPRPDNLGIVHFLLKMLCFHAHQEIFEQTAMAKLQSPKNFSRRFDPVTEAELSAAAEEADSVEAAALPDSPLPAGIASVLHSACKRAPALLTTTRRNRKDRAIHPGEDGPWQLGRGANSHPADVLEASGKTWRGWIVARDRGYATCWDLILGPEEEDRDPLCEIVQSWNPVRVSLPKDVRILGQLLPYRLAALRNRRGSLRKWLHFRATRRAPARRRPGAGIERRQPGSPAPRSPATTIQESSTSASTGRSRRSCLHPFSRQEHRDRKRPGQLSSSACSVCRPGSWARCRHPASRTTGRDAGFAKIARNKPRSPWPHPRSSSQRSVMRARAKPSNCGSPTPRPRRRKSSKPCAGSVPCPKPEVPGRT